MIETNRKKNPFPGLRPFETEEYRLFFGREGQSDALLTRLQRTRFFWRSSGRPVAASRR